jgi:5'-nucleotidase
MTPAPLRTALAGAALAFVAGAAFAAPVTIRVIAFNDLHGNLQSPGTMRADAPSAPVPAGGVDALAGYVAATRKIDPDTIVVSAGDLVGASPLLSALFHDEPTIEAMNRLGLDFSAVGNHEFDHGRAELLRLQSGGCHPTDPAHSCRGAQAGTPVPFEGAKFRFLAANVLDVAAGRTLFPAYGIKTVHGVKIAFIGLTLAQTPTIVTPAGVAGLRFDDEVRTINALIPELRQAGVGVIAVLLHQGGVQEGGGAPGGVDIDACAGPDDQLDASESSAHLRHIVAGLDDGVDLVISGHTHAAYDCRLPNAKGRRIPVTSANSYGRVLTGFEITADDRTGRASAIKTVNQVVDRANPAIVPDPALAALVARYATLAAPVADRVIGSIARALPATSTTACDQPAGDLIADAQLAATRAAALGGAQLALMNHGGVRGPGFTFPSSPAGEGDGNVTYGEAFTVQPFGNHLVTLSLTTRQLKDALEQQFAGCLGQGATRLLVPSAGFGWRWDATQACGHRISAVSLVVDGKPVELVDVHGAVRQPGATWRVTVNDYLAAGGDGFATFKDGTQRVGGAQDLDALGAYLADFDATTGHKPYDPARVGAPARVTRVDAGASCPE